MWFDLEPVPISFTEISPFRFENFAVLDAPPKRVFEILAKGEGMTEWLQDFVSFTWFGAPGGLASEREVRLKMLRVKERFIAWDEGKRLTFHVYAITLPLVSAFIEDFTLEPMGEGQTRFAWRAHYRPTLAARLVHPLVRGVFGALFESSIRRLTRYVKEHPTREAT